MAPKRADADTTARAAISAVGQVSRPARVLQDPLFYGARNTLMGRKRACSFRAPLGRAPHGIDLP